MPGSGHAPSATGLAEIDEMNSVGRNGAATRRARGTPRVPPASRRSME